MGHGAHINMNNKYYSWICLICPGGTHESRVMRLLILQYSFGYFPLLLSLEGNSITPRERKLFWPLSERTRSLITNQQTGHWIQEHAYEWEGKGHIVAWRYHTHFKMFMCLNTWWEPAQCESVCACLCRFPQFLHVRRCMHVCVWVCVRRHALTHCRVDGYALKQHCLVA